LTSRNLAASRFLHLKTGNPGKTKNILRNKRLNVGISKDSKTSTSIGQHETIIAELEDMGCCSILALNQAIT
jgi:hypothetical protein